MASGSDNGAEAAGGGIDSAVYGVGLSAASGGGSGAAAAASARVDGDDMAAAFGVVESTAVVGGKAAAAEFEPGPLLLLDAVVVRRRRAAVRALCCFSARWAWRASRRGATASFSAILSASRRDFSEVSAMAASHVITEPAVVSTKPCLMMLMSSPKMVHRARRRSAFYSAMVRIVPT